MATPHHSAATPETLITIKITVNNEVAKRLKIQLRDLSQQQLFPKLRQVLDIKPEQQMTVERYSDSASGYITLEESNPQVFKTLIRAAKAKLKLRLKATVTPLNEIAQEKAIVEGPTPDQRAMDTQTVVRPACTSSNPISCLPQTQSRDSIALDQRSVGSGIFQFCEARASQQTLVNETVPVPRPFMTNQPPFCSGLAHVRHPELAFRTRVPPAPVATQGSAWSVYCNACDKAMIDAHFHCSICDDGDYDLCEECVANGSLCPGEDHWLIKRFIKDGKVVNSTTERIQPNKAKVSTIAVKPEAEAKNEMPGAFADDTKTLAEEPRQPTRTCNNCVIVLAEREFVTCTICDDFDLCIKCHTTDNHGHHPAHGFQRATAGTVLPLTAEIKLAPGRNVRHNAICDGCEKKIYGVRHKCLNCPDWDYCNDCIKHARTTHPSHRFAALYEPLPEHYSQGVQHAGIYCDGPLCTKKSKQSYIHGIRYKCTICHDTDFCASCEAMPSNTHNRTHPLIKLKTPVRNVNISTESEDVRGNVRIMGDRSVLPAHSTDVNTTIDVAPVTANAATIVQTVAEIKPTEVEEVNSVQVKSIENIKQEPIPTPVKFVQATIPAPEVATGMLNAQFVHDSIKDGQVFEPETRFTQIWTMRNTGPFAWPAGCSVRFAGGDNMLDVDNCHPASVNAIASACESNIVGREVAVGEEIAFRMGLKAPKREGRSISYWRLKAPDGAAFGHRLWCEIEVKTKLTPKNLAALRRQAAQLQRLQPSIQEYILTPFAKPSAKNFPASPSVPMPQPMQVAHNAMQSTAFVPFRPILPGPPMLPPFDLRQHSDAPKSADEPRAYDSSSMADRLAIMREQQKQRREQMMAMKAQRERFQPQAQATRDAELQSSNAYDEDLKLRDDAAKKCSLMIPRKLGKAAAEKKSAEEETVMKIVEEATKTVEAPVNALDESEAKLEGSQMVFPKLEKESPESSTYESFISHSDKGKAAYVENEEREVEQSDAAVVSAAPSISAPLDNDADESESVDEELEVLSAFEDDSDDGFLTDEEYDILDASDSETLA